MPGFAEKLRLTFRMIRIEHSVFALPFALISALVAARGAPARDQLLWILVAMVSARSAAMAFNRLVDRKFDRLNPRTQHWPLASGLLSVPFVSAFVAVCSLVLVVAAYRLNPLAFALSPVALLIVFGYSLTKRMTVLSHWFLGLALALAPAGAWIAICGRLDAPPVILGVAILFWTAGFDLIYSCQDVEFDRERKLFSVPSRYGIAAALWMSRLCHAVTVALLLAFGWIGGLGWIYAAGVGLVSLLLLYEHSLVNPSDLSRVNEAFFVVNGFVSVLLLVFASLDLFL